MRFTYKRFAQEDFDRLMGRLRGDRPAIPTTYVVDEISGTCLIGFGSTSFSRDEENATYFNLLWDHQTVAMKAVFNYEKNDDRWYALYEIKSISVPRALNRDINTVREMIEDALAAYSSGMLRTPIVAKVSMPAMIDWV